MFENLAFEKIKELLIQGLDKNMVVYDSTAPPYLLTTELIFNLDRCFERTYNEELYHVGNHLYMTDVFLFYEDLPRVDRRIVKQILPELNISFYPHAGVTSYYLDKLNGSLPTNDHILIIGYNLKYNKVLLGSY
jgi:hypothetical protein